MVCALPMLSLLVSSLMVAPTTADQYTSNTFKASTFYPNKMCTGTPYRIEYDNLKTQYLEQGCIRGKDEYSWTDEGGITDVYAHAIQQLAGASFLLQTKSEGCHKYGDFLAPIAIPATGQCFVFYGREKTTSFNAEIRNNKVTYRKFSDTGCTVLDDTVEFTTGTKKAGGGYCLRGWLWQVYDATGQNWDEKASPPTDAPKTTAPPAPTEAPKTSAPPAPTEAPKTSAPPAQTSKSSYTSISSNNDTGTTTKPSSTTDSSFTSKTNNNSSSNATATGSSSTELDFNQWLDDLTNDLMKDVNSIFNTSDSTKTPTTSTPKPTTSASSTVMLNAFLKCAGALVVAALTFT